ncbi:MAG TPA: hypothetical protein VLC06_14695 [Polyangia bacterium]|nr:hypothetical protein [Polyangia bacterium]
MNDSSRTVWALAVVALSSTAGCSWILTQPLRADRSPYDFPVCSTSLTPPAIDTLLFVANAGTTLYLASQDNVSDKTLRLSVGAGAATLWLLSAIYGYTETRACTEAVNVHDRGDHRPAPFGTGGEVFTPPPPSPPQRARSPGLEGEDPGHPKPPPAPPPTE